MASSSNRFRKKLGEQFNGEFSKISATKSIAILSLILYNTTCYNLSIVAGSCILYELASNVLQIDYFFCLFTSFSLQSSAESSDEFQTGFNITL